MTRPTGRPKSKPGARTSTWGPGPVRRSGFGTRRRRATPRSPRRSTTTSRFEQLRLSPFHESVLERLARGGRRRGAADRGAAGASLLRPRRLRDEEHACGARSKLGARFRGCALRQPDLRSRLLPLVRRALGRALARAHDGDAGPRRRVRSRVRRGRRRALRGRRRRPDGAHWVPRARAHRRQVACPVPRRSVTRAGPCGRPGVAPHPGARACGNGSDRARPRMGGSRFPRHADRRLRRLARERRRRGGRRPVGCVDRDRTRRTSAATAASATQAKASRARSPRSAPRSRPSSSAATHVDQIGVDAATARTRRNRRTSSG